MNKEIDYSDIEAEARRLHEEKKEHWVVIRDLMEIFKDNFDVLISWLIKNE